LGQFAMAAMMEPVLEGGRYKIGRRSCRAGKVDRIVLLICVNDAAKLLAVVHLCSSFQRCGRGTANLIRADIPRRTSVSLVPGKEDKRDVCPTGSAHGGFHGQPRRGVFGSLRVAANRGLLADGRAADPVEAGDEDRSTDNVAQRRQAEVVPVAAPG